MSTIETNSQIIEPLKYLLPNSTNQQDIVLVLLNQDWTSQSKKDLLFFPRFTALWNAATFRVSVDGGLNILHQINTLDSNENAFIPNLLSGDFDSVEMEIVDHYKGLGTEVIHTPDQDFTDFTKCVKILGEKYKSGVIPNTANIIVVLGGLTDRFDHSMANINTLYTAKKYLPSEMKIFLLLGFSLLSLLCPGKTTIKLPNYNVTSIQLIPIGSPVTVTTNGFEKDLSNVCTSFDSPGINHKVISETVTITTDDELILMVSISNDSDSFF